jgi:hypothetical protein
VRRCNARFAGRQVLLESVPEFCVWYDLACFVRERNFPFRAASPGLRYGTLRLAGGVTFVLIAAVETEDGGNPISGMAACKEFQAGLNPLPPE